jgi:hypothetical protein
VQDPVPTEVTSFLRIPESTAPHYA